MSLSKYVYDAAKAQNAYQDKLSESRKGISVTSEELNRIDEIVSPRLQKANLYSICADEKMS